MSAGGCCCSLAGTPACVTCPNRIIPDWTSPLKDFKFNDPNTQPSWPWWVLLPPYTPGTVQPVPHKTVIEEFDSDGKLLKRTTIEDGKPKEETK
jgi:hypothetical protein